MRIAMFSNTFLPAVGGIEMSIDTTARQMRAEGHEVLVVAPEYESDSTSTSEILRVPAFKQFAGSPFSISLSLPTALADTVERFAPDLIHSHQPFLLGDSALRLARSLEVPIVYTHHTFMERYLHWFPVEWQILRDVAESLPVAYANLVDHVVTPTPSVADVMRERGTTTPIRVAPTGIDADFYGAGDRAAFRARFDLADHEFVLGHLGRLNQEKNLAYLGRAAAHFVAQAPERRFFLLVGQGDAVDSIREAFSEAGVAARLTHAGLLQGQDCADAYAAMDAFLFTSLTDTQGLVLSEAMAAGNPVFALDAPGARDIVEHDRTGLLFPQQTPAPALADAMAAALDDRDRWRRMQTAARSSARGLSVERCTQTMLDLYAQLLEPRPARDRALTSWDKLKNRWDIELALMQQKLSCLLK